MMKRLSKGSPDESEESRGGRVFKRACTREVPASAKGARDTPMSQKGVR